MRFILSLFVFLSFASPLWAVLKTDTHAYIVSKKDNCVFSINLKTGEEAVIPAGHRPQFMVMHEGLGYVVNFDGINIIDLHLNIVIEGFRVDGGPQSMVIHEGKGYVVCYFAQTVSIVDLKANRVAKTIALNQRPMSIQICESKGHVRDEYSRIISLIDLETDTTIEIKPISKDSSILGIYEDKAYSYMCMYGSVAVIDIKKGRLIESIQDVWFVSSMVIHGNKGYLLKGFGGLIVLDMEKDKVLKSIEGIRGALSLVIYGNKGYVVSVDPNTISVLALESDKLIKTIPLEHSPTDMVILGTYGYVKYKGLEVISILNLETNELFSTLQNPNKESLDIFYPYVYLGLRKVKLAFSTSEELKRYVEGQVSGRPASAYNDVLSPQEILDLLVGYPPLKILEMFQTLYQPLQFLNTPEGQIFCQYLVGYTDAIPGN